MGVLNMFICKIYKDEDSFIDGCRRDYGKFDALSIIDVVAIEVGVILTLEDAAYYYSSEWDDSEIVMYTATPPFQIVIYGDKANYSRSFVKNIKHLSGVVWLKEDEECL